MITVNAGSVTFLLVFLIGIAFLFDLLNGMHDAANSIATIVSTKVLSARTAVLMAAVLNLAKAGATAAGFVNGCGSVGAILGGLLPGYFDGVTVFIVFAGCALFSALVLVPHWNSRPASAVTKNSASAATMRTKANSSASCGHSTWSNR